ncbi:MAG: response regulator [Chitinophagaceae bacterium]|nr:response regulator [Chitinophagaceae bacterium]
MKKHILLIDDDFDEVLILCAALDDAGIDHTCYWASEVEAAVHLLQDISPDLILIDLNMPKTNGIMGIRRLRCLEHSAHVPIALYSTCILDATVVCAAQAGATCCIQKPDNLPDLRKMVCGFFSTTERSARIC